jgi:hypothetical protein
MRLMHSLIKMHEANWSACLNSSRKHATLKCIMGCLCRTDGLLLHRSQWLSCDISVLLSVVLISPRFVHDWLQNQERTLKTLSHVAKWNIP